MDQNYLATHEIAMANVEQLIFDNIPNVRDNKPGSTNPNDAMAAKLNGAEDTKRVGTAVMLKTMPGDRFTVSTDAYYEGTYQQSSSSTGAEVVESLLSALLGGNTYPGIPLAELPENIRVVKQTLENPALAGQLDNLLNSSNNINAPKAHLNVLFFDDKMQLIPSGSSAVQVATNSSTAWNNITPGSQVSAPMGSNYVLIYIDNQSTDKDVWFDNVTVQHYTSSVVEENHYYPYGLALQTAEAPNVKGNSFKYNGKELEKSFGLEMYDYGARMQDPQLGVWHSIDPLSEISRKWSPYNYAMDNPVRFIDPDGMTAKQYFDENGKELGVDEDGVDGNVQIVTDEKEIDLIKDNTKNDLPTDSDLVNSGANTNKDVLKESLNVLERTIKNGGKREEASLVTKNGKVVRAEPGEAVKYGEDGFAHTNYPDLPEGYDGSDVRAGIHSHPTAVNVIGDKVYSGNALDPSGTDKSNFAQFKTNIIVGPFGFATANKGMDHQTGKETISVQKKSNGVAIYNSQAVIQAKLPVSAVKKIVGK
jgi:RHS repeat-associated protein